LPHAHAHAPETLALAVAGTATAEQALARPHIHPLGHSHAAAPDHAHDHAHDPHHDHSHDHYHAHGHPHAHAADVHHHADGAHSHGLFSKPHTHLPPEGQRVTLGSLLALGISGGIIPCPSALVVLLSAIAFHRVGVGLVLIVAFSAGLAVVLTAIGLLMVYGRRLLSRLPFEGRLLQPLGVLSALAVAGAGLVIALTSIGGGALLP
jgi:ABC-type nickel/cobalt efflux system permease component RcnA